MIGRLVLKDAERRREAASRSQLLGIRRIQASEKCWQKK
jgi:hypothetical protein